MNKLLERWYLTLLILPLLVNYLTTYFDLTTILRQWNVTLTITLVICVFILGWELYIARKTKIEPRDKRIIQTLLTTLDLRSFEVDVVQQNSWYGFKKDAISKLLDFCEDAKLIENKFANQKLNTFMDEFVNSLDEFHALASHHLFSDDLHFYVLEKSTEGARKEAIKTSTQINKSTQNAFKKLSIMLDYLSKKGYLD